MHPAPQEKGRSLHAHFFNDCKSLPPPDAAPANCLSECHIPAFRAPERPGKEKWYLSAVIIYSKTRAKLLKILK
jgi:hypothetical protein